MKKTILFMMLILSLCACSRDGFKESLGGRGNKVPDDLKEESSQQSSDSEVSQQNKFITMEPVEDVADNLYIVYSVPVMDGTHDEAGKIIKEKIEAIMSEVKESFDLSAEDALLEIYDSVGIINDDMVSLVYEGTYQNKNLSSASKFAFGLTFSAKTGGQLTVSDIMQPHTLASLIIDEQSSSIRGKEEAAAKKREEISTKGMSSLADRIIAADTQRNIDNLLAFSFYLEKGTMVSIIPMDDDTSDPAYISVMCDKV